MMTAEEKKMLQDLEEKWNWGALEPGEKEMLQKLRDKKAKEPAVPAE